MVEVVQDESRIRCARARASNLDEIAGYIRRAPGSFLLGTHGDR